MWKEENINRPKSINDFKVYLSQLINDINQYDEEKFNTYFKAYLSFTNDILSENCKIKKKYSNELIAEHIFCTELGNVIEFTKYSLLAQIKTFQRVNENIIYIYNHKNSKNLYQEIRLMYELLTDSMVFIDLFKLKYNGQETNFRFGKSNFVDSSQIYEASKNLFRENINFKSSSITAIRYTSIFLIRQSIELRIKTSLGIMNIFDLNGNPLKLKQDILINFIKEYEDFFVFPVKFSLLLKIFKWSNIYVHNGLFGYLWLIDWAFIILDPLFTNYKDTNTINRILNGKFKIKEKIQVFNKSGSIRIKRDFYHNQMIPKLCEFISSSYETYDKKNIKFKLVNPEAMLVD